MRTADYYSKHGLNQLKYNMSSVEKKKLFNLISVNILNEIPKTAPKVQKSQRLLFSKRKVQETQNTKSFSK